MMALHKNLFGLDAALRQGNWTPQRPYLPELRGRNLLILGLGHIGHELVRWGNFLGMKITVLTRTPSQVRPDIPGLPFVGGLADFPQHLPLAGSLRRKLDLLQKLALPIYLAQPCSLNAQKN